MNYWSALGLEPTKEIRAIKRQYAKRLKTCHPEENPKGFMELEEAYQAAIKYAKSEYIYDDVSEDDNTEENDWIKGNNTVSIEKQNQEKQEKVDELFEGVLPDEMSYERQISQIDEIKAFIKELYKKYDEYVPDSSNAGNYWYGTLNSQKCREIIENPLFLEELIRFFNKHSVLYTKQLIKTELLPFFQSIEEKYNYGKCNKMLSDYIDKLIVIEMEAKEVVEIPYTGEKQKSKFWKVFFVSAAILWVMMVAIGSIPSESNDYSQQDQTLSFYDIAIEEKEQQYTDMFVEAGLIAPGDEIKGNKKIENHEYKNELSRIRARMIYFAVKNNARFEVIKPVFRDIINEGNIDIEGLPEDGGYRAFLSYWNEEEDLEFDSDTEEMVEVKYTRIDFYEKLFNFVD